MEKKRVVPGLKKDPQRPFCIDIPDGPCPQGRVGREGREDPTPESGFPIAPREEATNRPDGKGEPETGTRRLRTIRRLQRHDGKADAAEPETVSRARPFDRKVEVPKPDLARPDGVGDDGPDGASSSDAPAVVPEMDARARLRAKIRGMRNARTNRGTDAPHPGKNDRKKFQNAVRSKGINGALAEFGIDDPGARSIIQSAVESGEINDVNKITDRLLRYFQRPG